MMRAHTRLRMRNGGVFSMLSLFANGEPGGWWDPNDLFTLYQDVDGVIPVTAVDQPVGLMLDKHLGLSKFSSGNQLIEPEAIDWTLAVSIFQASDGYSTDYSASNYVLPSTADIWISPTGNDTTGNGSQALPYRSMGKAFTRSTELADTVITIHVVTGTYDRRFSWTSTPPDKDLNVVAEGGPVVFSKRYEPLTWTLHSAGTYTATRSAVSQLRDERFSDVNGVASALVLAATLAECEATPGTWFVSGSTIYAHRQDGTIPDSTLLVLGALSSAQFKEDRSYYTKSIYFEGGVSSAAYLPSSVTTTAVAVFDECHFRYSTENGQRVVGVPNVINYQCEAYGNDQDGFNYHIGGTNGVSPHVTEIDCRGFSNGEADNNDNGSTAHEDCRVLRVGGEYFGNKGPNVVDVGTSRSWNVGVRAVDSLGSGTSAAAFYAADTTIMLLEDCYGDSDYATVASGSAQLRHLRSTLIGNSFGDVFGRFAVAAGNHAKQSIDLSKAVLRQNSTTGAYYLETDGVDDWMQTDAIDMSASDKVSVFTAVRKVSDAAAGTVVEFSAAAPANDGTFFIRAPSSAAANYSFLSAGILFTTALSSAIYPAPRTNVLTGLGDISGDSAILRINGAQAAISTADQGAGNYGNHVLYLFMRAGTTLAANVHFYGLTIVGRTASSQEISSVERILSMHSGAA